MVLFVKVLTAGKCLKLHVASHRNDPRVFLDFSLLLVFHRMRELRESSEEVNTSGFATRIRRFAKRGKSHEKPLGCTNVVFDAIACNFYFI